MTEKDILRAMSGIDAALILDAEKPRKNNNWLKWASIAAGFCLIVYLGFMMKIAFTGANAPGPTNFYYDSFAEMNAAIGSVRTAQLTYAVRDTSVEGIKISNGQLLALVDGKILCSDDSADVCLAAIGAEFAGASYMNVFYGADITEEQAGAAVAILQEKVGAATEIVLINGGQPIYDYIISAE